MQHFSCSQQSGISLSPAVLNHQKSWQHQDLQNGCVCCVFVAEQDSFVLPKQTSMYRKNISYANTPTKQTYKQHWRKWTIQTNIKSKAQAKAPVLGLNLTCTTWFSDPDSKQNKIWYIKFHPFLLVDIVEKIPTFIFANMFKPHNELEHLNTTYLQKNTYWM